jgi:ribonuclease Y
METITIITSVLAAMAGGIVTFIIHNMSLQKKKVSAAQMINEAKIESEQIKKDQAIQLRADMQRKRTKFFEEQKHAESKISKNEIRLFNKEQEIIRFENKLKNVELRLKSREQKLEELKDAAYEKHVKIDEIIDKQNKKYELIASISVDEAKKELFHNLESRVKLEAAQMAMDIKSEAKENAQREAKEIIAYAIENLAYDFTMESTLATVQLPNERFKGMIIGREGRNIRAFEEIVGVKVIVDDTPELVVLSVFDPVQREIARLTMENLIKTKNINPNLIQQMMEKAKSDVSRSILKAAEDTLRSLYLKDVHPKIKENLGRLKYRYSYGQNMLQHAIEVALLSGAMAGELGLNIKLAKRAGLLHDIGKALTTNSEGSHVQLGVELCEKYNEHEVVINAIMAHHEEAEPISPISVLVTAADKISGSRPGARRDTLEAYTKRISNLENIANSFEGVNKTFAISAGREIRVIVEPEKIGDKEADILASDIAAKIKETMEYPGQIKVCVIRQTISSKATDEFSSEFSNDDDNHDRINNHTEPIVEN